jgi:hypothetical protein
MITDRAMRPVTAERQRRERSRLTMHAAFQAPRGLGQARCASCLQIWRYFIVATAARYGGVCSAGWAAYTLRDEGYLKNFSA